MDMSKSFKTGPALGPLHEHPHPLRGQMTAVVLTQEPRTTQMTGLPYGAAHVDKLALDIDVTPTQADDFTTTKPSIIVGEVAIDAHALSIVVFAIVGTIIVVFERGSETKAPRTS
jgi:hypothetical protein